jgi:dephospho-CoA kinase
VTGEAHRVRATAGPGPNTKEPGAAQPRRSVRIGLTGPIGCGKSTIAGWLAEHGAVVVDADDLAREVVAPGEPALAAVVAAFGRGVLRPDGTLDRAAVAARVFGDATALQRLEGIIRPAVRPRILAGLAEAEAAGARVAVLEAIGLVDGGYAGDCDEVWLITCDPDAQRARLQARGLPSDDAERRIEAQQRALPGMRAAATLVIDTSGTQAEARAAVEAALARALARRRDVRPAGNQQGRADGSARP